MNKNRDVAEAAIRSLRSTKKREPRPEEVVALLVRNQVPLLSLSQAVSDADTGLIDEVLRSDSFRVACKAEQTRYEGVHGAFAVAERRWREKGASSICFKSAGIAPSFPYTSENFDILFQPKDEPLVKEALDELGYVLLANCDEPQKWLYRLFEAGRSLCAIHVHTRVGWGQGFMFEPEIWRRRRPSTDDPTTFVPGPEDVLLVNTAHAFFENKEFGLHDLMKVRQAISDGVDWRYVERVARERGWLGACNFSLAMMGALEQRLFDEPLIPMKRFSKAILANSMKTQIECAQTLPLEMPFGTSWKLVKQLFLAKIARDKHEPLTFKPALLVLTLARAARSQTGVRPQNSALFAFSGVDGSGKTRQAQSLRDVIELSELRGQVTWARLGATPRMRKLSRLWSREHQGQQALKPFSKDEEGKDLHESIRDFLDKPGQPSTSRSDSLPGMVWAALAGADFALWLLQIRWKLMRGEIVIADRYLCDLDVELTEKLPSRKRFRESMLFGMSRLAPRPLFGFLFDIDADEAAGRAAPDSGLFDAGEAVRLYREKAQKYELLPVDASQSFEASSSIVQRESLRVYMNRLMTIGDLFYFKNPFQQNRPVRKQPEMTPAKSPDVRATAPNAY